MRLVGESFLTWRRYRAARILPFGLTLQQMSILRALAKGPVLTPSDAADLLFCDRPTASVVLGNLEKRAWVTRRRDPENGRRVLIELTNDGRTKLNELRAAGAFQLGPFDPLVCFTAGELDEFERLLTILRSHLETILQGTIEGER